MKPRRLTTTALLLILTGLSGMAGCSGGDGLVRKEGPEYLAESRSWLDAVRVLGGHGYWLITRGYHRGDDVVAVATNKRFSHASILDLERLEVIEAIGSGVKRTPLLRFLREAHRLRVVRPRGWTPERGRQAVAKARSKIGAKYDFLGVVGAPSKQRWYCSELAAWTMGIAVDERGVRKVLHPARLHELGTLLWDTGARDGQPDVPPEETVGRAQRLRKGEQG